MGVSTICNLIREVMDVLWQTLCPLHMVIPSEEKLFDIVQDFYSLWDLPHCIGAIDGSHIKIKKPPGSVSLYRTIRTSFRSYCKQLSMPDANFSSLMSVVMVISTMQQPSGTPLFTQR